MFLVIYLVGYIIYVYCFSIPKYNQLKRDFTLSICYAYDFSPGTSYKNSLPSIYYRYYVNGKEYKGHTQLKRICAGDLQSHLIFKTFPVAIDRKDNTNSTALIEPETFRDFQIEFPDSLQWVLKYIKK